MPYIKVNTNRLSSYQEMLNTIQLTIHRINSEYTNIGRTLDWDVRSSNNISRKIDSINNNLSQETKSLRNMSVFVGNARQKYVALDKSKSHSVSNAVAHAVATAANAKISTTGKATTTVNKTTSAWTTINKFIKKAGFIGSTASGFGNWAISGKVGNAKSLVSFLKSGKDAIKSLADWRKALKNNAIYTKLQPGKAKIAGKKLWKSAFGFDDVFKGKASKFKSSWSKRFDRNFNKNLDSQVGKFKKGGATSAFAWIGLGLNLAGNAVSNYEEAKNGGISTQRAIAETITETLVDTATGWAVGAAVAAGIAATFGSAPVLVVGAATVGVTMGLDFACKKITGAITGTEKGLTETISDVALDIGEAVSKGTKKLVSGAVNGIKNTGKKVGKFFGKLFGK